MIKQSWDNLIISNNLSKEYSGPYYILMDATEEKLLRKKEFFPEYSEMWDMLLTKLKPLQDPEYDLAELLIGLSTMGTISIYMSITGDHNRSDGDLFSFEIVIVAENDPICMTYMGSENVGAITMHGKDYLLDGYGDEDAHSQPETIRTIRKQMLSEQCGSEITKEEIDMIINAIKQYYEL